MLVQFYKGNIPNNEGLSFQEFMDRYGPEQMEVDHAWIQWVLPTKQPSNFNVDAPLLTDDVIAQFQTDPELIALFDRVVDKVLNYFCMERIEGKVVWNKDPESRHWLKHFNHNMLRMDRFIASLRYLGKEDIAQQVFTLLGEYQNIYKNSYFNYWSISAKAELP